MELKTTLEQLRDCEVALAAAHEREAALREDVELLRGEAGEAAEAERTADGRSADTEAALAEAQRENKRLKVERDTTQRNLRELHRQATIDRDANLTCNCIRWMDLLGLIPPAPASEAGD